MKIFINKTFKVDYRNNSVIYFIDETLDEIETLFDVIKKYNIYRLNHHYHYSPYDWYWNKTWNNKNYKCSGVITNNINEYRPNYKIISVWKHHDQIETINEEQLYNEILNYFQLKYNSNYLNIVLNDITRYIGRTNNIHRRTLEHKRLYRKGYKKVLYNFMRKEKHIEDDIELKEIYKSTKKVDTKRFEMFEILKDYFNKKELKQQVPKISDKY